jgi:hypothetical protein
VRRLRQTEGGAKRRHAGLGAEIVVGNLANVEVTAAVKPIHSARPQGRKVGTA